MLFWTQTLTVSLTLPAVLSMAWSIVSTAELLIFHQSTAIKVNLDKPTTLLPRPVWLALQNPWPENLPMMALQ